MQSRRRALLMLMVASFLCFSIVALAATEAPMSLVEHFDAFWKLFALLALALGLMTRFLFGLYTKRLAALEEGQRRMLRMVPSDALDQGALLMTITGCENSRKNCGNIITTQELADTMKVIKKAIVILVMHTDSIPKTERDKIAKDLIE